jgi:hypothetical protein
MNSALPRITVPILYRPEITGAACKNIILEAKNEINPE